MQGWGLGGGNGNASCVIRGGRRWEAGGVTMQGGGSSPGPKSTTGKEVPREGGDCCAASNLIPRGLGGRFQGAGIGISVKRRISFQRGGGGGRRWGREVDQLLEKKGTRLGGIKRLTSFGG